VPFTKSNLSLNFTCKLRLVIELSFSIMFIEVSNYIAYIEVSYYIWFIEVS